jgi:hypothetical protein
VSAHDWFGSVVNRSSEERGELTYVGIGVQNEVLEWNDKDVRRIKKPIEHLV